MRAAVPIAQRETLGAELDADRTESSDNRMAGATTAQIMDVTGYRDPKSLRRYTRRELLHDVRPGCAPLYSARFAVARQCDRRVRSVTCSVA